ncbi:uncharacterized protein LOC144424479 [Styela clava]
MVTMCNWRLGDRNAVRRFLPLRVPEAKSVLVLAYQSMLSKYSLEKDRYGSKGAGNVPIVTGGSSEIVRAIHQAFVREGASVAVLNRNRKRLPEKINTLPTNHGNKHCIIQTDVSSAEQVARAFDEATRQMDKKIKILVNNAGILRSDFVDEHKDEDFDGMMRKNSKGYFLMVKEFVKLLLEVDKTQEFCCIVNVSSIFGRRGNPLYAAGYPATKARIIWSTNVSHHNIQNTISATMLLCRE